MKYTKKSTITTRPRKHSLEEIAELYQSGMSCAEVGRHLEVHHSTVLYALNQLNIPRRQGPARRIGRKQDPNWIDFSLYRAQWRADRGMGPVERMLQLAAPRKSRYAA